MKYLKILKQIVVISMLISFSSCSNDNINEETSQFKQNENQESQVKNAKLDIIAIYSFDKGTPEEEQIEFKIIFRLQMSKHFTIYNIVESEEEDCKNIEKWVVDKDEYERHVASGGTSNTHEGGEAVLKITSAYNSCFSKK